MSNKRRWLMFFIGLCSSILFVIIDISESNFSISTFALPILMMSSVSIPALIEIIKERKKK